MTTLRSQTVKPATPPEPLMDVREAARRLGVTVAALLKWRLFGRGPAFHRVGRCVRYSPADLATWLETQRVSTEGK